eukprot:105265_1
MSSKELELEKDSRSTNNGIDSNSSVSCGDHLVAMIKSWSTLFKKKTSKNGDSWSKRPSKSKSKSKSDSTPKSSATPQDPYNMPMSRNESLAKGSAFLRKMDFSNLDAAERPVELDNKAYFEQLFSPPKIPLSETKSVASALRLQQTNHIQNKNKLRKPIVRSKSASDIM